MIYILFGFDFFINYELIQTVLFSVVAGSYLRLIIIYLIGQNWLKTYSQVITFAILPAIGYLITSVISSSIALSLGMVGALSIVRFRTPVKNPIELVMYFLLITMGIVTNVDPNLTLNFILFLTILFLLFYVYKNLAIKFNFSDYFFEEDSKYILNLCVTEEIELNNLSRKLIHFSHNKKEYMYSLSSPKKEELMSFVSSIDREILVSFSIDR